MCVSYDDLLKFIRETRAKSEQLWKERNDYATNAPILSEGTILDEEQSVRWNREEVARRNNSRKGKLAAYMTKINQCNRDIDQKNHGLSSFGIRVQRSCRSNRIQ